MATKERISTSKSRSRTYEGDRRKADLDQAKLMARRLRSHEKPISPSSTKEEARLGMRGLDEAEELEKIGSLEESLKLYELSIELLLKCMRNPSNAAQRDTIAERIRVALADAEQLKARLKRKTTKESPSQSSKEARTSKLKSAISNAIDKQPDTPSPPNAAQQKRTKSKSSSTMMKPPSRTSSQRSKLNYANDPLVMQVKTDLYVDSRELKKTSWEDIAGLARAKQSLQESAILPLMRPDLFGGLRKPQNILLYGPPGTGKTMLVKAVAHESSSVLFACSASTLTSKWHGESEKVIRTLFKVARDAAPALIFIDEMDALLSKRSDNEHEASRRFKTEFMVQTDGIGSADQQENHVLIVGATNCPWNVDDAVLRRFPRRILIPLPDAPARQALLEKLLRKCERHSLTKRQVSQLVNKLDGYSGSDIANLASEASFGPLRSLGGLAAIQNVREADIRPISYGDFMEAIQQSTRSVSNQLLQQYNLWESQQGVK